MPPWNDCTLSPSTTSGIALLTLLLGLFALYPAQPAIADTAREQRMMAIFENLDTAPLEDITALEAYAVEQIEAGSSDAIAVLMMLHLPLDAQLVREPNPARFRELLVPLANAGNADAQASLGSFYDDMVRSQPELLGMNPDAAAIEAYRWYLLAEIGKGGEQNRLRGLLKILAPGQRDEAVRQAVAMMPAGLARAGSYAHFRLGTMYLEGEFLAHDPEKALQHLQLSAGEGNPSALHRLGELHLAGQHARKDEAGAVGYFTRAADNGHNESQVTLGELLMNGQGIAKNEERAVQLFRSAANDGHARAYLYLGHVYRNGITVERDLIQAYDWYRKAADAGNSEAQFTVGNAYKAGVAVLFQRDWRQAATWYERAAEQGHARARYNLGTLYIDGGNGLDRDLFTAYRLILGSGVGTGDTQALLAALLQQMSTDELQRVKSLLDDLQGTGQ